MTVTQAVVELPECSHTEGFLPVLLSIRSRLGWASETSATPPRQPARMLPITTLASAGVEPPQSPPS